jgi:hypothetical protein
MKKFILIALVAAGFAIASVPRSEAGISIGIGIGAPIGYGYPYGCGYGYGYGYPYRYAYRPVVYAGPSFYWNHGHRAYYSRHHHHRGLR